MQQLSETEHTLNQTVSIPPSPPSFKHSIASLSCITQSNCFLQGVSVDSPDPANSAALLPQILVEHG